MVEWSIEAFRDCESIGSIVVACPSGHLHEFAGEDIGVVEGGATRASSVANALRAVGTGFVAIHDAARPLVTPELIEDVVTTLVADPEAAGAIAASRVIDTIKQVEGEEDQGRNALSGDGTDKTLRQVEVTLDRARLWAAQTPQVFRVEALREALAGDPGQIAVATDEAMLTEAAGGRVLIHPSPAENFKVTTPLDLKLARLLLADRAS